MKEFIDKYFTDYTGFKESFKRAVVSRVLPGWVWLGLSKDNQLVITQTNNEDNTLMHGKTGPLNFKFHHRTLLYYLNLRPFLFI